MLKVQLVEDNQLFLQHFRNLINWNAHGYQIVSTAVDGNKALIDFKKYLPELVITDVQLPGMNGIELTQEIKRISPQTEVIFLSSNDEFEYVRSALKLGVFNFILKQETSASTLYKELKAVEKSIRNKKDQSKYYEEGSLLSLLSEYKTSQNIERMEKYKKAFPGQYTLLLIQQEHILPVISEITGQYTDEIEEVSLKNLLYQYSNQVFTVIKLEKYQYLVLLKLDEPTDTAAYSLKNHFLVQLSAEYSFLIISEKKDIFHCIKDFYARKHIIFLKYFYPASVVLDYRFYEEKNLSPIKIDYREIKSALASAQPDQLCRLIDQYYLMAIQSKNYDLFVQLTKFFLLHLMQFDQQILDFRNGKSFTVFTADSSAYWMNANDIAQWIKGKFLLLLYILKSNSFFQYSKDVQETIKYINIHYMDSNLSSEDIAAHVNLSVNRLNVILKEEMNSTIWQLLTKVRMDKAKELLKTGEEKISNIYSKVGYTTVSYFSRAFKKMFGISPQEFRKSVYDLQKNFV